MGITDLPSLHFISFPLHTTCFVYCRFRALTHTLTPLALTLLCSLAMISLFRTTNRLALQTSLTVYLTLCPPDTAFDYTPHYRQQNIHWWT